MSGGRGYQSGLGAPHLRLVGSDHYVVRERSRGWSAAIAGICLAIVAISLVGYVLAMRAADAAAWVF